MFEPGDTPRVFGAPPGADFPRAIVNGLIQAYEAETPERLARVHLIVNTRRMARRIHALFDEGPARLLPRISLLTDFGEKLGLIHVPDPVPPLQRRLELVKLIRGLLNAQPGLAPRSALFDLADSLAGLMDEMHGEGVSPDVIEAIDTGDQSGHWERIKSFLGIVRPNFAEGLSEPDVETRQRMVIEFYSSLWAENPPDHPVIVAGSTGSRGATQLLMQTVAQMPQGAVVLPGFDFDLPDPVWSVLQSDKPLEDHPQYRFASFLRGLDLTPRQVRAWPGATAPKPARNRLLSLALRPAPVTDEWLRDGPGLKDDIEPATRDVTLLRAPSARLEALTIAMRLRQAAEEGRTAALITPDRMLTRQVAAALDRWDIIPDDSAGLPLHHSAPGRFLRHVADLFRDRLDVAQLLTLLKHPITHSGADRNIHLLLTRELELHLRRHGPPFPAAKDIRAWAMGTRFDNADVWAEWICKHLTGLEQTGERPLEERLEHHITLAEALARGPSGETTGKLWDKDDGREALTAVAALRQSAPACGPINASDYSSLFHAILSRHEVRNALQPHPGILIWGTLEARVQGADLLILAGLNEGVWPEAPKPDPWLNRNLRHQAGLLLPERRIGLSAHDFQQAALASEVWLTRSVRSDDAETVPSRWLNRLENLLCGLKEQGGAAAFEAMARRGDAWLRRAELLEEPGEVAAARRPSPCPPTAARPRAMSVTEIKRLIRDPYAIYARHVLRLRPLDPLMKAPDALLRGIVLHDVLEQFVKDTLGSHDTLTREALIEKTGTVLAQNVPWAEARAMWLARMERIAEWFIETEIARRQLANPVEFEAQSAVEIAALDFTLTAKADRIDMDQNGALHIYDYKTGAAPSRDEQRHFDKQLLLEAAMAEKSGFGSLPASPVARAVYISLANAAREVSAPIDEEPPDRVWQEFEVLIESYLQADKGFTSRRAMFKKEDAGDYDQLARFGEWDITDDPESQGVG